ncbi:MAG: M61 family metallopeptidase [Thalassotalea sp.]
MAEGWMNGWQRIKPYSYVLISIFSLFPLLLVATETVAQQMPSIKQQTVNHQVQVTVAIDSTQAEHHLAQITITLPVDDTKPTLLKLPTWRTGKYKILNLANGIRNFTVLSAGEKPLTWQKTTTNTWQVEPTVGAYITISYQVYANQLSLRTRHIDDSHAFLNASSIVMYSEASRVLKHKISLVVPEQWQSYSGLPRGDNQHQFIANNYDHLADAPIETGINQLREFSHENVNYRLVIWGEGNYQVDKMVKGLSLLVKQTKSIWQVKPFTNYLFIVHATSGASGATEHHNSTIIQRSRYSFHERKDYIKFLATAAHELIHAWNVKSYRPQGLAAYDYQQENYSSLLWLVEGSTSYFQYFLLLRAGLISSDEFLQTFAEQIEKFDHKPGQQVQTIAQGSFDKWQEEGGDYDRNYSVNIYTEGYLTSWLLDLALLTRTRNKVGYRDVHQWLFDEFKLPKGYTQQDILLGLQKVSHKDFSAWWQSHIHGKPALDFQQLLKPLGLIISYGTKPENQAEQKSWAGISVEKNEQGLVVTAIAKDSPAWLAGLTTGDILIAVNGLRLTGKKLSTRFNDFLPAEVVQLTLFRRDQLINKSLTLASRPKGKLSIKPVAKPTRKQKAFYQAWTGTKFPK